MTLNDPEPRILGHTIVHAEVVRVCESWNTCVTP